MNGKVMERPQHMLMRVSVGIHKDNIPKALEMYELMSPSFTPTPRRRSSIQARAGLSCPRVSS